MKQGIQDEFAGINEDIHLYGCYFLDLLEWAARDSGINLEKDDILSIYSSCKKAGYIGAECFINNAAGVYNLAAGERKYKSVSKRDFIPDKYAYIICGKKPMYTHFTLCYKGQVWDSLNPDRQGAKAYKPASYRVLI